MAAAKRSHADLALLDPLGAAESLIPKIDPSRHPVAITSLLKVLLSVVRGGSDAEAIAVLMSRRLLARLVALAAGAPSLDVRTQALDFLSTCLLGVNDATIDANAVDVRSALSALTLQLRNGRDANLAMVDKVVGVLRALYLRWKPTGRSASTQGDRRAWIAAALPLLCVLPHHLGAREDFEQFDTLIANIASEAKALAHDLAGLAALDHGFRAELLRGLDDGFGTTIANESLLAPLVPMLRVAGSVAAADLRLRDLDRISTGASLRCLAALAMDSDDRVVATLIALPLFLDIMRESSRQRATGAGDLTAQDHALSVRDMYVRLVTRLDRCQASMWTAVEGRGWRGLLVCRHMLQRALAADVSDAQSTQIAGMASRAVGKICSGDVDASRVAIEAQLLPLLIDSVRRAGIADDSQSVATLGAVAALGCCVEARQAIIVELPLLLPLLHDGGAVASEACMVIAQLCLHEERTLWLSLSRYGGFRAARVIVDTLAREVATVPPPPMYPSEFHAHLSESTALGQLLPDVAQVAEWCCDRSEVLLETKFPEMESGAAAGALESIVEELRAIYTIVDHDIISRLATFAEANPLAEEDAAAWPQISEQIASTTSVLRNMSAKEEVTPAQKREMLARHMATRNTTVAYSPARSASNALESWATTAGHMERTTRSSAGASPPSTSAVAPTPPPRPPSMQKWGDRSPAAGGSPERPSRPYGGVAHAVQEANAAVVQQRAWAAAAAAEEVAERMAEELASRPLPQDNRYRSLIAASRSPLRGRRPHGAPSTPSSWRSEIAASSQGASMWDDVERSTRTAGVVVLNRRQLDPTTSPATTSNPPPRPASVARTRDSPLFSGRSPAKKAMLPW